VQPQHHSTELGEVHEGAEEVEQLAVGEGLMVAHLPGATEPYSPQFGVTKISKGCRLEVEKEVVW
jgi:hypothetical protein